MNVSRPSILRVALVTIEARTALSVGSGRADALEDAPVVLDAMGLPHIHGTSIAGVLRSLARENGLPDGSLFGAALQNSIARSRLEISKAWLHASDGQPAVKASFSPTDGRATDPLLREFQQIYRAEPIKRRRVRMSERGTADDEGAGLFDRSVVPRGTRFTFEICLWSSADNDQADGADWQRLLDLLLAPSFRIGAQTRAGLGAIKVRRIWSRRYDLAKDFNAFRTDAPHLQAMALGRLDKKFAHEPKAVFDAVRYRCRPTDFWRVGGTESPYKPIRKVPNDDADEADMAPFVERIVVWSGGAGKFEKALLIPGSSLKGALRHRTTYHWCRLAGVYADRLPEGPPTWPSALDDLFGSIKKSPTDRKKSGSGGQRGRVLIDDIFVTEDRLAGLSTMTHNAIDRFTGGVRSGFLFSEQLVWKGDFEMSICVLPGAAAGDDKAEQAFWRAVDDLMTGRLPIGAAAGRGHGRLKGERQ